jgi:PAP2 superfamily
VRCLDSCLLTAPVPPVSAADHREDLRPAVSSPVQARRARWWTEVLVIVWLCWVYDAIANLAPMRQAAAYAHATSLLHVEKALHIDPEAGLDHWLARHHTMALLVSNYYDNAHFVVTLGLVGWLWWSYPLLYRPLRTGLVLTNVIGMAVFWLYPLAPPRLLDPGVYTDVVASTHAFGSWHSGTLATAANQLAAMPSLHMAWAGWSALALWRIFAGRRFRWLVWLYPAITSVAVLSTGNHYVLDVLAGLATFVVAMFIADRWEAWWTARQARRAVSSGSVRPDV